MIPLEGPVGEGPWDGQKTLGGRAPTFGRRRGGGDHGKGEQAPKHKYDQYLTGISSPVTSSTNSFENTCQVTCQCEENERWVSLHVYKILQQDC